MSRGGRHGHAVQVEKTYWLMASEDCFETDSDRKRKGSKAYGPPSKKVRTENEDSGGKNGNVDGSSVSNENRLAVIAPNQPQTSKCSECGNENNGNRYVSSELFDDIESVGSEYEGQNAFISELFNGIESVSSVDTNVSENENINLNDFLNIFGDDFPSDDDDEDRVIITEIFDDTEVAVPDTVAACDSCKDTTNKL